MVVGLIGSVLTNGAPAPFRRRLKGAARPPSGVSSKASVDDADAPSPTSIRPGRLDGPTDGRAAHKRRAKPRTRRLSRVTILSATVGGDAADGGATDRDAWRHGVFRPGVEVAPPPLPLLRVVSATIDREIDALEARGWWVTHPSPALLVRAASDDAAGDADLCF